MIKEDNKIKDREAEEEERELVSSEQESKVISSLKPIKNKVVGSRARPEMLIQWTDSLDLEEELESPMRRKEELAEEIGERSLIVLTKEDNSMRDFRKHNSQVNFPALLKQLLKRYPKLRRIRRLKRLRRKSFSELI